MSKNENIPRIDVELKKCIKELASKTIIIYDAIINDKIEKQLLKVGILEDELADAVTYVKDKTERGISINDAVNMFLSGLAPKVKKGMRVSNILLSKDPELKNYL